jgi:hypothetical protein
MKTLKTLSIVEDVKVIGLVLHTSFQHGRNRSEVPSFFTKFWKRLNWQQFPIDSIRINCAFLNSMLYVAVTLALLLFSRRTVAAPAVVSLKRKPL